MSIPDVRQDRHHRDQTTAQDSGYDGEGRSDVRRGRDTVSIGTQVHRNDTDNGQLSLSRRLRDGNASEGPTGVSEPSPLPAQQAHAPRNGAHDRSREAQIRQKKSRAGKGHQTRGHRADVSVARSVAESDSRAAGTIDAAREAFAELSQIDLEVAQLRGENTRLADSLAAEQQQHSQLRGSLIKSSSVRDTSRQFQFSLGDRYDPTWGWAKWLLALLWLNAAFFLYFEYHMVYAPRDLDDMFFAYWIIANLIVLVSCILLWIIWRIFRCCITRMCPGYYYDTDLRHYRITGFDPRFFPDDLRPDSLALAKLKHQDPILASVEYELDPARGRPYFERKQMHRKITLHISVELFCQLLTPVNFSLTSDDATTWQRMSYQTSNYQNANISRYLAMEKRFIMNDTLLVAYAYSQYYKEQRSGCYFPRTPVAA